jgi:serine/threonine protein kinase
MCCVDPKSTSSQSSYSNRKQENEEKFRNQSYYEAFEKLVVILREIKEFIQDVTYLSGYRKFISSNVVKERFQQLIEEFDHIVNKLQLTMAIANEEERKEDVKILQKDIDEMTKFLEKIGGGVTTTDKKISNVFEHILTLKGQSSEKPIINTIDPNELIELANNQNATPTRNEHKIHNKLYKGLEVVCKIINENNKSDKIGTISNSELAILSNLSKSDYIIKFYGLSHKDGNTFGVFGWAENNLRELYEKFEIEWPRKLKIALNICCGIIFLHGW